MRLVLLWCVLTFGLSTAALAQGTSISLGGLSHDQSAPVEISADALNVDQTGGTAEFLGNVVIGQGDLKMAAQSVRVIYGDNSRIARLKASGNVTLATLTEAIEAEAADYDLDRGMLLLSGDVLFTQNGTALSANRMSINLNTGQGQLDGRVRAILQAQQ